MTVALHTSGGIMTRLGHILGAINDFNSLRGGTATTNIIAAGRITNRVAQIVADFNNSPINTNISDGIISQLQGNVQQIGAAPINYLKTLAANIMIQMVADDTSQYNPPLTLKASLQTLITQMKAATTSVLGSLPVAGAQTNVGTPTGTPLIVASVIRGNGLNLEYLLPDTLTFTVTADSSGSATANNEPVSVTSLTAISDPMDWRWPGGNGQTASLNIVDATKDNSAGNNLVNSGFEVWTAAIPDNWLAAVGAGQISKDVGTFYTGLASAKFTGDSATLTALTQSLNTASAAGGGGGTPFKALPDVPYAFSVYYKLSAGSPAAGVLAMELIDGAGTIIQDDNAVNNTVNVNLNGVGNTNWNNLAGVFRFPASMPASTPYKIRLRLSTALTTGTNLNLDHCAMNTMVQFNAAGGGPFLSIFSSKTKPVVLDAWTMAFTTTWGNLQKGFQRLFNMTGLGLQLPSNVAPTELDSLIA